MLPNGFSGESFQLTRERSSEMAMPLGMATYLMRMVWFSLSSWVFTCLSIADEIAASLRSGDIDKCYISSGDMIHRLQQI
ncbi:unnamed protein product [Microthlaspi erraticum]|uniref:Uncharacterized protein n=1 Tax=Microthlaspi erraticum TaxID=1685480 RepID=A0A6D2L1X5_9BRAS|nr:unnamed protein product [Microthlaspi erraticum]